MSAPNQQSEATLKGQVAALFRKARWSVREPVEGPDLIIRKGDEVYVLELKRSSEGRSDRLVPLMAQAILQAQVYAKDVDGAVPLAVVAAPRVPPRVARQVEAFALEHAPNVAVGIIDSRGLRRFSGAGLHSLTESPVASVPHETTLDRKAVDLFSDLNQWLIKSILAPYLDNPTLLNAPLLHYRSASELARVARVSVMTAFRFLRQLQHEGFLHDSSSLIRLVRVDDLFERWRMAAVRPSAELGARWLLRGDRHVQIGRAIKAFENEACLGFFAAADALRLGVVRGVPTHLYVRKLPLHDLAGMRLTRAPQRAAAEIIIREPSAPESVFRGAVNADGSRASDVLQIWLDVHDQPTRGKEQADVIYRRIIGPMLRRVKHGKGH